MKKRIGLVVFLCGLLCSLWIWGRDHEPDVEANAGAWHKLRVVIDPGHGGFDPGKVGAGETYEKDLNLQIALHLKAFLECQDVEVVLTRQTDEALGNTKKEDMYERLKRIQDSKSDICVIIHQNSYSQKSVHGLQLFYPKNQEEGLLAAKQIQESVEKRLQPDKLRPIKSDATYYLLKGTTIPTILIECGFLSNENDLGQLTDETYQKRLAWSVCRGILQWQAEDRGE